MRLGRYVNSNCRPLTAVEESKTSKVSFRRKPESIFAASKYLKPVSGAWQASHINAQSVGARHAVPLRVMREQSTAALRSSPNMPFTRKTRSAYRATDAASSAFALST